MRVRIDGCISHGRLDCGFIRVWMRLMGNKRGGQIQVDRLERVLIMDVMR